MFPFRDANPSRAFPIVTVGIIVVNVLAFFWELSLGVRLEPALLDLGVVPRKWLLFHQTPGLTLSLLLFPYFSSIFLHGGWFHLISNMWWLWIFGDNVEDHLGRFRFLFFYLASGLFAGAVHTFFNLNSILPAVGASGAVAGVLGAYLILFPHARIQTLVPFFLYYEVVELPAVIVLGFWFLAQFLSGTAAIAMTTAAGGVAWWAHVGGFLAGMALLFLLEPRKASRID
jgi:membrane associated rhomboid family serine protease